jgi:hypothetical protein
MGDHTKNFHYQQERNIKRLPEKQQYFCQLKCNSPFPYSLCTLFIYVKRGRVIGLLLSEVSLPYIPWYLHFYSVLTQTFIKTAHIKSSIFITHLHIPNHLWTSDEIHFVYDDGNNYKMYLIL